MGKMSENKMKKKHKTKKTMYEKNGVFRLDYM